MSAGMEYAYNFAKASKGGGVFGWFYKTFNSTKYEKTLNSLASIKKIIDTDMYFANNNTYNLYLELMEESTSVTGEYMPVWKPTPCTVTQQEVEDQQIVVVEELYKMKKVRKPRISD
jgi:predicted phage-related endonuclease